MFGAVTKADTNISVLIQQSLRAVGRTDDTKVTAFTDGCPGLRSILVDAGITAPPFLDWFHIAMRICLDASSSGGFSRRWLPPERIEAPLPDPLTTLEHRLVGRVGHLRDRFTTRPHSVFAFLDFPVAFALGHRLTN